jgi:hypothetical protein
VFALLRDLAGWPTPYETWIHSVVVGLTTRTSHGLSWMTPWLVEPRTSEAKLPRPRVPTTIRRAPTSRAYSLMMAGG